MNKQVLGAIVTSVIILVATLVPSLANASSLFDFFCAMTRAGAASGPQQNSCLLQQGQQLLNQYQQNQGINQNLNCPSGTQQVGSQCLVINGLNSAANNAAVLCQTQNSVITPLTVTASTPSQVVSTGSTVTITAVASPSVVSTGFGVTSTCSQITGTIPPGGYSWQQTAGTKINATATNLPTLTFVAPRTATSLVFSVTVTDSNNQQVVSTPVLITVT
jgi:hypothetical protein